MRWDGTGTGSSGVGRGSCLCPPSRERTRPLEFRGKAWARDADLGVAGTRVASRVTLDEAGQPARLEEKQAEDNLKGLKSLEASEKVEGTSPRMAGSAQGSGHSRSFPLQEEAVCGQEGAAG